MSTSETEKSLPFDFYLLDNYIINITECVYSCKKRNKPDFSLAHMFTNTKYCFIKFNFFS